MGMEPVDQHQHHVMMGKREDIVLDPDGDVTLVLQKHYMVEVMGGSPLGHGTPMSGSGGSVGNASPVIAGVSPGAGTGMGGGGAVASGNGAVSGIGNVAGNMVNGIIGNGSVVGSVLSSVKSSMSPTRTSTSTTLGKRSSVHTVVLPAARSPPRLARETRLVYAKVSSKHLMLASSVFRAMLRPRSSSSGLAEASALREKGWVEIPLPEDDADAMVIILNIIHHRYSEVARAIPRSLLAQVAVLVDKYDLRRSVEFVSTTWFDNFGLGKKRGGTLLPTKFSDELLEWLFISWVFGYADIFFGMTRIAMAQSWCRLDNDSLQQFPFPNSLIEMIDHRRQRGIQKILHVYETFINRTWGDGSARVDCPAEVAECDAKVLGTLLRAGRQLSIYPIPRAPFPGISFTDLSRELDSISVPTCGEHYYYNRTDFNEALNTAIKGEFAEGLLLKSFYPGERETSGGAYRRVDGHREPADRGVGGEMGGPGRDTGGGKEDIGG